MWLDRISPGDFEIKPESSRWDQSKRLPWSYKIDCIQDEVEVLFHQYYFTRFRAQLLWPTE